MHICEQIYIYKLHKMAVEIRKLKSVDDVTNDAY